MSVHASAGSRRDRTAAQHALLVLLAVLVVTGAGWAWAFLASPPAVRPPVAWGGGAAGLVIVAAVTAAFYYAGTARRSRRQVGAAGAEGERLKREFAQLTEQTVPTLVERLGEGAPVEAALAEIPRPGAEAVRNLLRAVAGEVAAAERRAAEARADRTALEKEVARLSGEVLPTALRLLRDGAPADVVLAELPNPAGQVVRGLLDEVVEEVAAAERRGASAMAACASAAARIQAQTTRLLAELREMEHRYGDDKVFADLMELDHRVSQLGRLADTIALLAGGRSGRRWTKPIPMESILRGAMGRIDAYQRVRLHSTSSAAVVGYAAEGVMHALAEVMDNAAAFSAHGSEVHVYVDDEDVGLVLTIEDSGLGMRKRERGRAEALVSRPFDLATLPGTRMGLATVGRLASRYGLSVNFRPSSRGGTGVVVMVPRQLIAQPKPETEWAPPATPAPPVSTGQPLAAAPGAADGPGNGMLAKRPRGSTLAAAGHPESTAGAPPPRPSAPLPARNAGERFAAFHQAGERTRNAAAEPEDGTT
jgi:signal transduction histidine kinase